MTSGLPGAAVYKKKKLRHMSKDNKHNGYGIEGMVGTNYRVKDTPCLIP